MRQSEEQEIKELSDINVVEVSLVGRPANRRKFLLVKSNEEEKDMSEKDEKVELEEQIEKALTEEDKNAIKGAMNILGKTKDGGVKGILAQLRKLVGLSKQEEPELEPEPEKEEEKEEVEKKFKAVEKERDELKDRVAKLEKAARLRELEDIAKSLDGNTEENVRYLESISESLPEDKFKAVVEREQAHAKKVAESELFKEKGSSRPAPGSAEEKILAKVHEVISKGDKPDVMAAYNQVMAENPDLYEEYLKETNKPARENPREEK